MIVSVTPGTNMR